MIKTQDRHPAIMTKRAVLARSGVYIYSYQDMVNRGMKPKVKKEYYTEYRPAEVLVRCKDMFAFAVMSVEHTEEETNPENFGRQTDGVVGDTITTELMPDGETGVYGNIAFYTKDGVDYFNSGVRETSADYRSKVVASSNPAYDYELVDILSVNGVALTQKGRGGSSVRVMDSIKTADKTFGGLKMKRGILGFLGIGRSADAADFKISTVLLEHAKKIHDINVTAGRTEDSVVKAQEEGVKALMSHITPLSDRDEREVLIGAVTDSLLHPFQVLEKKDEVAKIVDNLYTKCRTADAADFQKTLDEAGGGKEETDEEKAARLEKEKGSDTKDSATKLVELVEKMTKTVDSIPALVDAAITKRIGNTKEETPEEKAAREKAGRSTDTAADLIQRMVRKELGLDIGDKGGDTRSAEGGESRSTDSDLSEADFLDHI